MCFFASYFSPLRRSHVGLLSSYKLKSRKILVSDFLILLPDMIILFITWRMQTDEHKMAAWSWSCFRVFQTLVYNNWVKKLSRGGGKKRPTMCLLFPSIGKAGEGSSATFSFDVNPHTVRAAFKWPIQTATPGHYHYIESCADVAVSKLIWALYYTPPLILFSC